MHCRVTQSQMPIFSTCVKMHTRLLSKSRSSAAVLEEDQQQFFRPSSRNLVKNYTQAVSRENLDQAGTNLAAKDVHTNHVKTTVCSWGKSTENLAQGQGGQPTPKPSRHIGESFADNKISKQTSHSLKASTVQATSEPSLAIVNVAVERANNGENQKMHFSQSAQDQMRSFQESSSSTIKSTSYSSSFSSSTVQESSSMEETTNWQRNLKEQQDKILAEQAEAKRKQDEIRIETERQRQEEIKRKEEEIRVRTESQRLEEIKRREEEKRIETERQRQEEINIKRQMAESKKQRQLEEQRMKQEEERRQKLVAEDAKKMEEVIRREEERATG